MDMLINSKEQQKAIRKDERPKKKLKRTKNTKLQINT